MRDVMNVQRIEGIEAELVRNCFLLSDQINHRYRSSDCHRADNSLPVQAFTEQRYTEQDGHDWLKIDVDHHARGGNSGQGAIIDEVGDH